MQRIDIHNAGKRVLKLKTKIEDKNISNFLMDKKIGKFGKRIGEHQTIKYYYFLKYIRGWIGKPFEDLTEQDTTVLYTKLDENKILQDNKKPYTDESKNAFMRVFKTYLRWLCNKYPNKENLNYDQLAKWIKPFNSVIEIPALSKDEIFRLAEVNNLQNKALILTLFDTGARIQEFLNIRIADITLINDDDPYFKIKLRREFSKTKGREVSCRICRDALKPYFGQRKKEVKGEEEALFNVEYDTIRKLLQRSKDKAGIKKRVSPHVIRHSSATYFANVLKNPFQLEYRFGWSIGDSKMVNRYIDANGLMEEQTAKTIKNISVTELREENEKIKIQLEEQQRQMEEFKKLVTRYITANVKKRKG